jgi:formamidopyrimidine-DNA glycosylase
MPELPEVETTARWLRPRLVGRRFGACEVRWKRTLGGLAPSAFNAALEGVRVSAVGRRAKWIVLELTRRRVPAGVLCVHLRMTGRVTIDAAEEPPGPWERVRIALDDGRVLRFVDPRKFGRVRYARRPEDVLGELGPEPLGSAFTAEWLAGALGARRRLLKPLLLDQTFLGGLGNIYVDESLHRAGLHPLARSERVTRGRAERLCDAIREVLTEAIAREGSSFDRFYRTPEGRPGGYQDRFRVYGRAGEPCLACGTPIRHLVVGQRGSHVCPRCQPRPRAAGGSRQRRSAGRRARGTALSSRAG